jgi:hypothetical protein
MADENVVSITINALDKSASAFTGFQANLEGVMKSLNRMAVAYQVAGAALAAYSASMVKSTIETAAQMGLMAQQSGVTVEAFYALTKQAGYFKVSADDMEAGLKHLSKAMADAQDLTTQVGRLFKALGVSTVDTNGKLRQTQAVFVDLVGAFSRYQDGAGKVDAALQLFGARTGQTLIPMLNQGKNAVETFLNATGGITSEMAEQAHQFEANLRTLQNTSKTFWIELTSNLLPALNSLSGALLESSAKSTQWAERGAQVAQMVRLEAVGVYMLASAFMVLQEVASTAAEIIVIKFDEQRRALFDFNNSLREQQQNLVKGVFSDIVSTALAAISGGKKVAVDMSTEADKALKSMHENLKKIQADLDIFAVKAFGIKMPKMDVAELFKIPSTQMPLTQTAAQMQAIAALQRQMDQEGLTGIAKIMTELDNEYAHRLELIDRNAASEEQAMALQQQAWAAHQRKLTEIFQNNNDARQKLEDKLNTAAASAWEQRSLLVKNTLKEEITAIDKMALDYEDKMALILAAIKKTKQQELQIYAQNADAVASVLGTMASAAQAFGKKGFAIYKIFASLQAVVSTAAGVARALADWPWPYSLIVGGIVAAAGAIQIAKINSAGQAHSGLDYVPRTGTYILEQGEAVIKRDQNARLTEMLNNRNSEVNIYLDGQVLGRGLAQMSRDGRLNIYARAIV